jgi:hypothetical protein
MTRSVALRAGILFIAMALVFGLVGLGSHAAAAQALFLISALCAVMLLFGLSAPVPTHVPVRVARSRPYR